MPVFFSIFISEISRSGKPHCSLGCENGGQCVGYNVCMCPVGYKGAMCQNGKFVSVFYNLWYISLFIHPKLLWFRI
jgi:hypothetical protein